MGQKNGTACSAASKKGCKVQSLTYSYGKLPLMSLRTLMLSETSVVLHRDLLGHYPLLLPLNYPDPRPPEHLCESDFNDPEMYFLPEKKRLCNIIIVYEHAASKFWGIVWENNIF